MTPLASHPALTPTYLIATPPGMPTVGAADELAPAGGRRADNSGMPRSLDELLVGAVHRAGATTLQKMASIQAVMPVPELFDEGEDEMIHLQNMLGDFSIAVSLQSALARKGVGAIETLIRS